LWGGRGRGRSVAGRALKTQTERRKKKKRRRKTKNCKYTTHSAIDQVRLKTASKKEIGKTRRKEAPAEKKGRKWKKKVDKEGKFGGHLKERGRKVSRESITGGDNKGAGDIRKSTA